MPGKKIYDSEIRGIYFALTSFGHWTVFWYFHGLDLTLLCPCILGRAVAAKSNIKVITKSDSKTKTTSLGNKHTIQIWRHLLTFLFVFGTRMMIMDNSFFLRWSVSILDGGNERYPVDESVRLYPLSSNSFESLRSIFCCTPLFIQLTIWTKNISPWLRMRNARPQLNI